MKVQVRIICFLALSQQVVGQFKLGSWNTLNVNLNINEKWNAFAESQLRSLSFYDEFHYYEIKTGITYKINKQYAATTGFGSYNTFSEGANFRNPMQNKEIRTWLQFNMKQSIGTINLEHRYRAEQRFTSVGYRNRFRYRLSAMIPLNDTKIEQNTLYLNLWNELFFTDKEPFFERNRSLIGLGYELNKKIAIQAGYIYQFDYKINDEIGRDFINFTLLYHFNLKKEYSNFIPSTND